MSIKTVLFDLDGTLLDTNELIIKSFDYTFKQYGLSFTREEIMAFNGPPLWKTFKEINPIKAEDMLRTYRDHNLKNHEKYVKVFPYVIETIAKLQEKEIKMAIVTAKMRNGAQLGIEMTGLHRYFKTIVTVDDVTHSKPHPEPVLKAMEALKSDTKSTIMVGDNYHDIEAGKNAGILTAGVAWSMKGREFLEQLNPTYMLEDMRDLLKIVGV